MSIDLPHRGSKDAPRTFRGNYSDVQNFIDHYERVLKKCNITSEREKCESILMYCAVDVQYVIRTLEGYEVNRWAMLKRDILKHYDAERVYQKHKPVDVKRYVAKHREKTCSSLTQWRHYYTKFHSIAGGPLTKGHLSREDYNAYFWIGIHPSLHQIIENRILQANPWQGDMDQYTVKEIDDAAERHFRRDRYETLMVWLTELGENLEDEDSIDGSSEESSESELSESDFEIFHKKKKLRVKKKKKETKEKQRAAKKKNMGERHTQQYQGSEEEVTSLIRKLSTMRLDDPEYAPIYYQVMVMDERGLAEKCVKPPAINSSVVPRPPTPFRPAAPRPLDGGPGNPATYPNNIPLRGQGGGMNGPGGPATGRNDDACYGCFGVGHRINECPRIAVLVANSIIKTNPETRRLVMMNGSEIRRYRQESLGSIRLPLLHGTYGHFDSSEELVSPEVYLTPPAPVEQPAYQVNPVERTEPSTRKARRVVFDGVFPPRREKTPLKAGEKQKKTFVRPPTPISETAGLDPRPIEARRPRGGKDDDDEKSIDGPKEKVQRGSKRATVASEELSKKAEEESGKVSGRQSELSGTVDRRSVLNRVLDTPVTMTFREILVTSKDLRTDVQDLIKVKNVRAILLGETRNHPLIASFGWPQTNGILIKIDMKTGGRNVCAIIDTGSELNIVRGDTARQVIQQPVDMGRVTSMNDANGGQGQLRGLIQDVDFSCGGAFTMTDLWVSQTAPFSLLLGWPWQRGNLVSIDEREEGTYLVF
ncbi:hypothetical protein K438DRAFT_1620500, partial [Mycena galopus ATCC 62051]